MFVNTTFVALAGLAGWMLKKALMELEVLKGKIIGRDNFVRLSDTVNQQAQTIARHDALLTGLDGRLERIEDKLDRLLENAG